MANSAPGGINRIYREKQKHQNVREGPTIICPRHSRATNHHPSRCVSCLLSHFSFQERLFAQVIRLPFSFCPIHDFMLPTQLCKKDIKNADDETHPEPPHFHVFTLILRRNKTQLSLSFPISCVCVCVFSASPLRYWGVKVDTFLRWKAWRMHPQNSLIFFLVTIRCGHADGEKSGKYISRTEDLAIDISDISYQWHEGRRKYRRMKEKKTSCSSTRPISVHLKRRNDSGEKTHATAEGLRLVRTISFES